MQQSRLQRAVSDKKMLTLCKQSRKRPSSLSLTTPLWLLQETQMCIWYVVDSLASAYQWFMRGKMAVCNWRITESWGWAELYTSTIVHICHQCKLWKIKWLFKKIPIKTNGYYEEAKIIFIHFSTENKVKVVILTARLVAV